METRTLGNDLRVTAVGLGCMGFTLGYGKPTDKKTAMAAIRKAYKMGCRFFDTAEIYQGQASDGSISYNEEIVGEALHDVRDQVVIATKLGIRPAAGATTTQAVVADSRPETIIKSVEASLKRLNTDHIDLYYQHRIDPNVTPESVAQTMKELIAAGKITHWGISEANEEYLRRANAICKVTAVQNRYSMMYRESERLFPVLEELNVGLVAFSPLANGFLTGHFQQSTFADQDTRSSMPQFTPEAIKKNQELLELLNEIADSHHATSAQVSLAWMLNKKPYIVLIPGSRHLDRIKANLDAATIQMSESEVALIDKALDAVPMSDVFGGTKVE
ncbi:MAG: aldo/keto reductase [Limosilactobacillus mucosae]|nr:aldo/keto reductase [Limosilactobacillus mucosae]MCI6052569.1 aldo/keto reductase [Limosilactobacillus mucosae]